MNAILKLNFFSCLINFHNKLHTKQSQSELRLLLRQVQMHLSYMLRMCRFAYKQLNTFSALKAFVILLMQDKNLFSISNKSLTTEYKNQFCAQHHPTSTCQDEITKQRNMKPRTPIRDLANSKMIKIFSHFKFLHFGSKIVVILCKSCIL